MYQRPTHFCIFIIYITIKNEKWWFWFLKQCWRIFQQSLWFQHIWFSSYYLKNHEKQLCALVFSCLARSCRATHRSAVVPARPVSGLRATSALSSFLFSMEWAQIDSGTPSAPKLVFCGPRSRWKMDPKVATFKLQKMETVFSTLVGFLAMECQWTCIGWLLIGLGHGQGLAQHTCGQKRCPWTSPKEQKWWNFRAKKSAKIRQNNSVKNPKKIWKFFSEFFYFQWLKNDKISCFLHKSI